MGFGIEALGIEKSKEQRAEGIWEKQRGEPKRLKLKAQRSMLKTLRLKYNGNVLSFG